MRMTSQPIWILSALLLAGLFFGCERKPGDKLYREAIAEWRDGNPVRARALLEKSIRRRTGTQENAEAYNHLGILLYEMNKYDEAIVAFTESCKIDGTQFDVICNMAVALIQNGNFQGAEEAFREAAVINPSDSRPLAFSAVAYLQQGRWEEAERNLNRALARDPNNPQLQSSLAIAEAHTKGPEQALARLKALASRNPDFEPAIFNQASLQKHWLHNEPAATELYERFLRQTDSASPIAALAQFALHSEPSSAAIEVTDSLGIRTKGTADRAAAEQLFQKALRLHSGSSLSEAIDAYRAALELDDSYAQAFYNLGSAYFANEDMKLAREAFQRAIYLDRGYTDARYNAALIDAYYLDQPERAQVQIDQILLQQPSHQAARDLNAYLKTVR